MHEPNMNRVPHRGQVFFHRCSSFYFSQHLDFTGEECPPKKVEAALSRSHDDGEATTRSKFRDGAHPLDTGTAERT